jgi:hypothetical protein
MTARPDTGYQDYLRKLSNKYYVWLTTTNSGIDKEQGLEEAREIMQQRYPGNYVLDQIRDPSRGAFELVVKFDDPKEELLWKIKWS